MTCENCWYDCSDGCSSTDEHDAKGSDAEAVGREDTEIQEEHGEFCKQGGGLVQHLASEEVLSNTVSFRFSVTAGEWYDLPSRLAENVLSQQILDEAQSHSSFLSRRVSVPTSAVSSTSQATNLHRRAPS